jgi:membrane-associated protein
MNIRSIYWAIALMLFLGGLGLPLPENPVLMGGGYAIHRQVCPPVASLLLWYLAILLGDSLLFACAYWLFTRPGLSALLRRYVGENRLHRYRRAFAHRGAWTLFLARFTFGIRALAYLAAGAAHYPWRKFLAVDGLSVAIQLLLFVGIGYYAGERITWAQATGERIALVLSILALFSIVISYLFSLLLGRLSSRNSE